MSVYEPDKVDAIGIDKKTGALTLMVADPLTWEDEYAHLEALEEKLNAYIAFVERRQYESVYPGADFDKFVFELCLTYELTDNARTFLQAVAGQVGPLGITLRVRVG